jgi:hypothetical protein
MTSNSLPTLENATIDLRPGAVLPIGLACDESLFGDEDIPTAVTASLAELLQRLNASFRQVVAANSDYFSSEPALCRIVTLPPAATLQLPCGDGAQVVVLDTAAVSATPDRAREQAHQLLLANIDLLLVVWDGKRADRRGSIDALVQSAVIRRLPVIVVIPALPVQSYMLMQADDDLDAPIALDLEHRQLPADLGPLVRAIMIPAWDGARRCLLELCAQPTGLRSLRVEYDLLLTVFRARPPSPNPPAAVAPAISPLPNDVPPEFKKRTERIDELARYYASLTRSSSTSEFLVLIIIALLSSVLGLLVPSLAGTSIIIQVIVNGLLLVDITIRRRHRWVERWLDYRALAERLRAVQTLHPIGRGDGEKRGRLGNQFHTWTDWYGRRLQRMLPPPKAPLRDADLPVIADGLRATLDDQLAYHRRAFILFRRLERRLHSAAHFALLATVATGIGTFAAGFLPIGAALAPWHRVALLALAVLPAVVSAFNGIRADADLAQLAERSALTASRLKRLRRGLNGAPLTQDRVINAAIRLAHLMEDELSEWRLMLHNRRLRRSR